MTFLMVFGAVSVAPHSGGHILVYVRVESPLAQAASTQSQYVLVSRSRRADDVPGITHERRRECLHVSDVTIGPLYL